jgi:hypothetical protein
LKEAWNMVFKVMECFQSHHKAFIPKNFKNEAGKEVQSDVENERILQGHYHNLFNHCAEVDYSALTTMKYNII